MAKNQMDLTLLAQYSGMFRWRIRRHLKPAVFCMLKKPLLERYAALFKTTVDELTDLDHVRDFHFRNPNKGLN
jgi:hypothetical protein